jgi:hypothetical protein
MTEPAQRPTRRPRSRARWWLLLATALILLATSQALWFWQTWPVRALLEGPPPSTGVRR